MANQELEVKFVVDQPALTLWDDGLITALNNAGFTVESSKQQTLSNTYFDTAEHVFEQYKMGMRVRGVDGRFEQTIKTQRNVNAGMHERLEFNIPLTNDTPDLTLFPAEAWPENLTVAVEQLVPQAQFSTHFERKTIVLACAQGRCELVFDQGEISTDKNTQALNEIEIELIDGQLSVLLEVARCLNAVGMRLSDESKAAQGYALLNGINNKTRPLPPCISLHDQQTTEQVFCMSSESALAHWQYHEHLFFAEGSKKMLPEIATGIRVLLQSLALFLPVLQCDPMLKLQREVLNFSEKWLWVDELKSTRFLLSRKGPFYKTLSRQTAVMSYLQGRQTGLLQTHQPEVLMTSQEALSIKLSMIELLTQKPWQQKAVGFDLPVIDHARGWLSQGWQTLHQAMQSRHPLLAVSYTTVETLMRQTLYNGYMLSDLFPHSGPVRAPWLDLLVGIDEIRALQLLKQVLQEAELDYEDGLDMWIDEKMVHLLQVMERTRQVAMTNNMYW